VRPALSRSPSWCPRVSHSCIRLFCSPRTGCAVSSPTEWCIRTNPCLAHICSRFLPFAGPNRTHSARGLEVPEYAEHPIEYSIEYPEHPIEYPIEYPIECPIEYPIEYAEHPIEYSIEYSIEYPSSTRKRHEG
jgi:hypothetical protein